MYSELLSCFKAVEHLKTGKYLSGYIVFTEDSFTASYSEIAIVYRVSSNNKAFQAEIGGCSIYGSVLDGNDPLVRLEQYKAVERNGKDGWKIEKCYVTQKILKS